LLKTVGLADVKEALAAQGAEAFTGTPEDFRRFLQNEIASTARVMKAAQLQPE
jgi:tripartite-type tricarboxylate transporter receptor subunit TctC